MNGWGLTDEGRQVFRGITPHYPDRRGVECFTFYGVPLVELLHLSAECMETVKGDTPLARAKLEAAVAALRALCGEGESE